MMEKTKCMYVYMMRNIDRAHCQEVGWQQPPPSFFIQAAILIVHF